MIWHYAFNGERRGPVGDDELQGLVHPGVITPAPLVWHEGMADWAAYHEQISSSPPVSAGRGTGVVCAGCGGRTPPNDTVEIPASHNCPACNPRAYQGG